MWLIFFAPTHALKKQAALVTVSDDGKHLAFDPKTDLVPLPGGCKKFTIRFDAQSRLYWTFSNDAPAPAPDLVPGMMRNTLALVSSPGFKNFGQCARSCCIILTRSVTASSMLTGSLTAPTLFLSRARPMTTDRAGRTTRMMRTI